MVQTLFPGSTSERFSVKKAYQQITQSQAGAVPQNSTIWKVIWRKSKVIPRVQLFLWKIVHEAIPLGAILTRRGIKASPTCQMCGDAKEDVQHFLFHCPFSRVCWLHSPLAINSHVLGIGVREALIHMRSQTSEEQWLTFTNIIWALWRTRNDCVYSSKQPTLATFQRYLSAITSESQLAFPNSKESARATVQPQGLEGMCCFVDGS